MPSQAVASAVKSRLTANPIALYDSTNLQIVYPNETMESKPGFWMFVQYPISNENFISMAGEGNRVFRENGTIRFLLMATRNSETDYALGICETVRSLFRAKEFGGVTTFSPSPPVINDDNDNATHFELSMSVEYIYDIFA